MSIDVYPPGSALSSALNFVPVTAPQAGITLGSSASPTDLTGLTAQVTVPGGRTLKITGHVYQFDKTGGTQTYVALQVREGSTELARRTESVPNTYSGADVEAIVFPTAGTHTYKLSAYSDATMQMQAAAATPAWILVEDITGTVWPQGSAVTAGMVASEPWSTWTPVITADTTAPTLGVASVATGRYQRIGRIVTGYFTVLFGTSGTNAGAGSYRFSLPVLPAVPTVDHFPIGTGYLYDVSGSVIRLFQLILPFNNTYCYAFYDNAGIGFVTATAPWAWSASDRINAGFTYEAAS